MPHHYQAQTMIEHVPPKITGESGWIPIIPMIILVVRSLDAPYFLASTAHTNQPGKQLVSDSCFALIVVCLDSFGGTPNHISLVVLQLMGDS